MLIKVEGSTIVQAPYNLYELYEEYPNTTFPRPMPDEVLESYGIYRVVAQPLTEEYDDATHTVEYSDTPELIDGSWMFRASIVERTAEDLQGRIDGHASLMRRMRDDLLAETDWWAVSDRTMTAEETTYRQALRDLPTHANWPYLEDADWPVKPS